MCLGSHVQVSSVSEHSGGALELNTSVGLGVQFAWTEARNFSSYADLKTAVRFTVLLGVYE